jgi:hypothetical protein
MFQRVLPRSLERFNQNPSSHDREKCVPVFRKDHAPTKIKSAITIQLKAIAL